MAKFYGKIGFIETTDDGYGVWTPKVIERDYIGDVIKNTRRWDNPSDGINDNLNLNNSISIISDDFAIEKASFIKYVEWMGSFWEISSIEIQRPRLILTIGGVYNGPRPDQEPEEATPPAVD